MFPIVGAQFGTSDGAAPSGNHGTAVITAADGQRRRPSFLGCRQHCSRTRSHSEVNLNLGCLDGQWVTGRERDTASWASGRAPRGFQIGVQGPLRSVSSKTSRQDTMKEFSDPRPQVYADFPFQTRSSFAPGEMTWLGTGPGNGVFPQAPQNSRCSVGF